jgi:IS5 family transposase
LLDTLLSEVNRQLSAKRLYIKAGEVSIVDATVTCAPEGIEAKQSRPRKGKDGGNTQDSEAGYSVKVAAKGKTGSTYGYKAHVNVDTQRA